MLRRRSAILPSGVAAGLSVLKHLGSNLNGRRGNGDDGTFFVEELAREEADVAALAHNAASSQ